MRQAALSTSATNTTKAKRQQPPLTAPPQTIWEALAESHRIQLIKYWAQLIRQAKESQTIEGGHDELR